MSNNDIKQKNGKQTLKKKNPVLQLTLRDFVYTIITILGIFLGFYKIVIQPDIQQTAEHQKELYQEQKIYINREFQNVNSKIDNNTKMIESLTNKLNNLNRSVDEIEETNGSFGSPSTTSVNIDTIKNKLPNNKNLADKGD